MIIDTNDTDTADLYYDADAHVVLGISEGSRINATGDMGSALGVTSSTVSTNKHDSHEFDAFLYIIIVLSFYAISMVLLMIKYIRREEEELSLDYYYEEFVKREKFQNYRLRNLEALERTRRFIAQKGHLVGNLVSTTMANQESPGTSSSETTFCLTSWKCRETAV